MDSRRAVLDLVAAIRPHDDLEVAHRGEVIAWITSGAALERITERPVRPRQHLVSYFLVVDSGAQRLLLGDHRRAGLWLPPGGHVEPGEHPAATVRRESVEELALAARFHPSLGESPFFLTVTETRGDEPHRDVSLWFVLEADCDEILAPDRREYREVRWWSRDELGAASPALFDPHFGRALSKLVALTQG